VGGILEGLSRTRNRGELVYDCFVISNHVVPLENTILIVNESQTAQIYFIPAFFLPPEKILGMGYLDGVFNWNAAWSVYLPCVYSVSRSNIVLKLRLPTWFLREGQWGTIQLRPSKIGLFSRA
jgi:hypothetical protein